MKIKEIIKESNEDMVEKLKSECSQTIELMKKTNEAIYHGSSYDYQNIEKITPKSGRTPRDTPKILHNLVNEYLIEKGIKTNRGNSIFGLKKQDFGYGSSSFVLFPVNNANILWFKNSGDLYQTLIDYVKANHDLKINNVSENELNKNHFKQFLYTLEPNTSLEEYLKNINYDSEIMISSPLYIVKNKIFETTEFKEQIGLL